MSIGHSVSWPLGYTPHRLTPTSFHRVLEAAQQNKHTPTRLVADGGYASAQAFLQLECAVALCVVMREKLRREEGKRLRVRRIHTVERAFGIIKEVTGLRQFLLRRFEKVSLEWGLVCTAYNLQRVRELRGG